MRIPRFQGLRGRLSYANVMATLAFFFALTGGALAGVKYILASDVISATSDLAGSTYGNPLIANGKITSAKFAPTAKAPDADRLDGIDSTQFLSGYGTGEASAGWRRGLPIYTFCAVLRGRCLPARADGSPDRSRTRGR